MTIERVVSGGQTGVDRAALDAAAELSVAAGGWCPAGRLAEDGAIPERYRLVETPTDGYEERTRWNVRDSDATLVLTVGRPSGGTAYTIECARECARPYFVLDLHASPAERRRVVAWLAANRIRTLNVAGPRESKVPGVYRLAKDYVMSLLTNASAGETGVE